MRKRTKAREIALQALYQHDVRGEAGGLTPDEIESFVQESSDDPEVRDYARLLIDGTLSLLEDIDRRIVITAQNWRIQRMAPVDRCILRIALFEITESGVTPPKVAMNEAIELAKKYSTEQSGAFVNGILDRIYRELDLRGPSESTVET
jgi:transcription antitermination factor NusB